MTQSCKVSEKVRTHHVGKGFIRPNGSSPTVLSYFLLMVHPLIGREIAREREEGGKEGEF